MGNIVSGFATGVFLYCMEAIGSTLDLGGGIMHFVKFILMGILSYNFVMLLSDFEKSTTPKSIL